ncbi:MAG: DUF4430 domain-containing protein [Candidatus Saccharimonadales bacterium]
MKKSTIAVIVLAVVAVLAAGVYGLNRPDTTSTNNPGSQQVMSAITFSEDGKTVTYTGEEGVTALATLESLTSVTVKDSSFGKFVTGINGVEADESKEYWSFYVNGAYASEGAGTYTAKSGDLFEWRLEALQ